MKRLALGTAVLAAMMTVACNQEKAADTAAVEVKTVQSQTAEMAFTNDRAKQSYAMGAFVGQQMTRMLDAYKELGIELEWSSVSGKSYVIEWSESGEPNTWRTLDTGAIRAESAATIRVIRETRANREATVLYRVRTERD